MACDFPCVPYVTLYILSLCIIHSNSRSSTHWKLDTEQGRIVPVNSTNSVKELENDTIMNILVASGVRSGVSWTKTAHDNFCVDCTKYGTQEKYMKFEKVSESETVTKKHSVDDSDVLDCGKVANFTYYDHLLGIANRHNHPHAPEPHLSLVFKRKNNKKIDVDLDALERKLRKAKKEKPRSVQLYNQIGNFWRVKGDTQKSIECFRRALAVSPNNAEVLLNLARVLLNLQYLDDAIFLARKSLEVQSPDKNSWQQHFTMGEILKAYGHYQEAALHLKHAIELKPDFQPAVIALKDMEFSPDKSIHKYTLLIIVFLVLGVLLVILSSLDNSLEDFQETKTQRHINRAIAMKSLKMGISPRALRTKRYNSNC